LHPALATSYSWSADGNQLTMNLRKGVKFHDGQEMTAKDVDFTLKLMVRRDKYPAVIDPTIFQGYQDYHDGKTDTFAGISVLDDYTVRFNLVNGSYIFLLNLSDTGILPAHGFTPDALTSKDDLDKEPFFLNKPFGTGPFKLNSFDVKTFAKFDAHKDYWKGAPNLDSIIIRFDMNGAAKLTGLQSGQIDGAYSIAEQDAATLQKDPSVAVTPDYSLADEVMFMVSADKDHMNIPVRQALASALDVEGISKTIGYGFWKPAPSRMMWAPVNPNPDVPVWSYNPEKAKQLLKTGNWDSSRKLKLGVASNQASPDAVVSAIINNWKAVGVDTEYVVQDPANQIKEWDNHDKVDLSWTADGWNAYDPSAFYQSMKCGHPANYAHYCNQQVQSIFEQAAKSADYNKVVQLYKQAQVIMATELPYITPWITAAIWAINKKMHGGILGRGPLTDAQTELWWKE
jgi:peptide/nickel transport system substrate-binding protein